MATPDSATPSPGYAHNVEASAAPDQSQAVSTKAAGRGGLALAGGKLYFLVSGLAQQILLSRILGVGGYGALSTAQSVASISYNPIVQAGIQGVSREVAGAEPQAAPFTQNRLLRIHAGIACGSAVLFFALAAPLSGYLGAPHLRSGLQILSGVLLLYGLYAPLIGILNGSGRFLGQAGLDMLASTLRTVGLVVGAYVAVHVVSGPSERNPATLVNGTVTGFVVAAVAILLVAVRMTGVGKVGEVPWNVGSYLRIVLPILGGQILLNVLFQADALLLRKFTAEAALSAGLAPAEADPFVGAYRQTQLFCFLPYQLLTSITFVLFPLLATARAQGRRAHIGTLIERGLRIALIVAGLIVSVVVAIPAGLLALVFGPEAAELGASSMRVLGVGMGFFAVLGVMTSAMNSLGAERPSLILIALAAILVFSLCILLARSEELGPDILVRTASATSMAMLATTLVASVVLKRLTGATLPWLTSLRTGGAVAICAVLGAQLIPRGHLFTLLGSVLIPIAFLLILLVTGELRRGDWDGLTALLRR